MADLGALAAGAVPAPIYPTLTAEQSRYIADHSGAVVAVVADERQEQKLRGTAMRSFVRMDDWRRFLALAEQTSAERAGRAHSRR